MPYVISLGLLMVPFVIQKQLAELKCVSILLFTAIFTFIGLFIVQLFRLGNIENHDENYGEYYEIKLNLKLVTAMNITTVAYAFQTSLFPTYNSLGRNRSTRNALKTVTYGLIMTFSIYISLGILSIYIFGSELHASVLQNVNQEDNMYSLIIRLSFLVVLACHIPYVFFPTKESLLIMVDEWQRGSMNKALLYGIQQAHFGEIRDQVSEDEQQGESSMAYQNMNSC